MTSILKWDIPEKKTNRGGSGYEIAGRIWRGYLKTMSNFQGCSFKSRMEFLGVLVLDLERYHRILWSFWGEDLFCLEFPEVK